MVKTQGSRINDSFGGSPFGFATTKRVMQVVSKMLNMRLFPSAMEMVDLQQDGHHSSLL